MIWSDRNFIMLYKTKKGWGGTWGNRESAKVSSLSMRPSFGACERLNELNPTKKRVNQATKRYTQRTKNREQISSNLHIIQLSTTIYHSYSFQGRRRWQQKKQSENINQNCVILSITRAKMRKRVSPRSQPSLRAKAGSARQRSTERMKAVKAEALKAMIDKLGQKVSVFFFIILKLKYRTSVYTLFIKNLYLFLSSLNSK